MEPAAVTSTPTSTQPLEAITTEMVRLHKATCGRGPRDAQTHLAGDVLVCLLRDGFTKGEMTLVESGDVETVSDHRRHLHEAMRARAIEVVESHLGRRVATLMYSVEPKARLELLAFVLAPAES
jgi:uncharacterized protein YbcI